MRVTITILATYATLVEAQQARFELSKLHDNLAVKNIDNTYKLIRYEVNSSHNALDVIIEDTPSNHRNSSQSRKRKRSKSDDQQLQFE